MCLYCYSIIYIQNVKMYLIKIIITIFTLFNVIDKVNTSICICTNSNDQMTCTVEESAAEENFVFNNVQHLKIQCKLERLQTEQFSNTDSLNKLDLSHNLIAQIPTNFFTSMTHLTTLNISHNNLRNPTVETFHGLQELKILDISYNRIIMIENPEVLGEMKNLEKLYITDNGIFSVDGNMIQGLPDLELLDLSYNHIREIWNETFKANEKLQILDLSGNNLVEEVHSKMFDDLKKVTHLKMSDSKIKILPEMFDKNTKLIYLDISKNTIQKLPQNIFKYQKDLQVLSLSSCQLLNLPVGLFKQATRLENIDLSINKIRSLPEDFFNIVNLKYLNISDNIIRELSVQIFHLTNLVSIDLSNNLLTNIIPELIQIKTLKYLYLQNNQISRLNHLISSTSDISSIIHLDLSKNKLVYMQDTFIRKLSNLQTLEFLGNPWNCQCLEDTLTILEGKGIKYTTGDYFKGILPVCVETDRNTCEVDDKNLTYYYNTYTQH